MRPDQLSGVSVHSIPAWCGLAMLTNRRLRTVVSRPRSIAEAQLAGHHATADVERVAIGQHLYVGQPDRVLALDPQLEHRPVGQVDQVLIDHRDASEDRRLAVVDAMDIGPGVMRAIGVLPLGCPARAEVTVPGRGQNLAQTLRIGVIALVAERKRLYRERLKSLSKRTASLAASGSRVKPPGSARSR